MSRCELSTNVIESSESPTLAIDECRSPVRPEGGRIHVMEVYVAENKFLTTEEVSERYRGEISVGTLRNWRAQRVGPPFIKVGKSALYPVQTLDEWDRKNP